MQNLNILNTEVKTMTSKEICDLTGRQHKNTLALVRSLIDKGLIHSAQFQPSEYTDSTGRKLPMYKLDRKASVLTVAQQSPEFMSEIVDRWDELENRFSSLPNFNDPGEAAQAWADQYKLTREQTKLAREKTLELAHAAPKIAVYEVLADRKESISTTDLAKRLGTNAQVLNEFLRDKGIKFKKEDLPMAKYDDWFNVISGVKGKYEYRQCLISPLGQRKIAELWYSHHNTMMSLPGQS